MKKVILASLLPMLMASSFSSQAAESATLNIKGTLTPSSCDVSVSGAADYGTISTSDLVAAGLVNNGYQLGTIAVPYTINCSAAQSVAFTILADELPVGINSLPFQPVVTTDTGGGATDSITSAGVLGTVNDEVLGYFGMARSSVMVNGESGQHLMAQVNGNEPSWTTGGANAAMFLDGSFLYSQSSSGSSPTAITTAGGTLHIGSVINPNAISNMRDNISFSTNATLALTYL